MINAHNNLVQWKKWKMLRRFPGRCNPPALVTTERWWLDTIVSTFVTLPDGFRDFSLVTMHIFQASHWSKCSLWPPLSISGIQIQTSNLLQKYLSSDRALMNHDNQKQLLKTKHQFFSAQNIPGVPGEDYPIFVLPPETQFDCNDQIEGK